MENPPSYSAPTTLFKRLKSLLAVTRFVWFTEILGFGGEFAFRFQRWCFVLLNLCDGLPDTNFSAMKFVIRMVIAIFAIAGVIAWILVPFTLAWFANALAGMS